MRPTAKPPLDMAENSANARTRALASLMVLVISASVFGPAAAAPRPCAILAMISQDAVWASPANSEAMVNTATPMTNIRRLPSRSPARPPSSSRQPKSSV